MQNGTQQLPEGFIVRTKEGKLMVVRNGRLVDVHASSTPPSPISVQREPLTPPPAPVEKPQSRLEHVAPAPMPKPIATPPAVPKPATPQPATPPTTGMLAPSRPLSTASTPAYMIDAQDELDIAEHKEKVVELGDGLPLPDLDEIIRGIINHHQLTFTEEVMEKRFMSIIRSRLSELRNSMETEEVLERPQKIGGMGFESGLIRRLMVDVEEAAATIASKGRIADLKKSMSRPRPSGDVAPYAPKIPITPPHPSLVIPERPTSTPAKPTPPPSPAASEVYTPQVPAPRTPPIRPVQVTGDGTHDTGTDVTSRITMVPPTMPTPLVAPAPMPSSSPTPVPIRRPEPQMIQRPVQKTRTTVSDIVQAPAKKTLGPVDELAELTLIDFRRFGSTAAQCKEKVLEKLELLEEESFAMRSAGVKAWRRSPVFQQYLAIGRESIETGSSIQDIIARHSQSDAEVMTYEEFEAVSDLNRSLRY